MKSSEYWARRMTQLAQRQMRQDAALEGRLSRAYDELMHELDRELAAFYARYAANEGITMAEARKLLSGAELEGFRMTLDEFRDKAKTGGYDKELNEIYLRSRVSRIQALQTQIAMRTHELYQSQRDLLHAHIANTYTDTFYRTVYEVQRGAAVASTFAKLDPETVEKIISRPWLENDFSGRVWANRDKLVAELQTTLAQAFTRGDPLDRTAALLAKRMNVAKSRAMALVQTESAHFAAQATARGYAETGVKQYDYLATLDERTCDICGPLDGKTFKRSEMQTGVNYPPLHTRCRCTTVPHFDDDFGEPRTRATRDPVTGKSMQAPDMTYREWREKYVAKSGERGTILSSGKPGDTDGFTTLESVRDINFTNAAAIKQELESFVSEHALSDVEHALVLSPDGKGYHLVGLEGTVNTALAGEDALRGAVVIHNHPVPRGEPMADSFSKDDVRFAVVHRAGKQYLISGTRRNAFTYHGDASADDVYVAYERAFDDVRERAFCGELEIVFEKEEIMKALDKYLEGFKFYESF